LVAVLVAVCCTQALGDPPIAPPTDPSSVPALVTEWTTPTPAHHALQRGALRDTKHQIRQYRTLVLHWQTMLGQKHRHFSPAALHTRSVPYARWVLGKTKRLSGRLHTQAKQLMVKRTDQYQQTVYHWQMVLGRHVTTGRQLAGAMSIEQRYDQWQKKAEDMLEEIYPANFNQFLCIHHYEGAWNANTGNGYYGGLQMDRRFQSLYGGYLLRTKGTADHWTPLEQMVVGQIAHDSGRGFYPWPNTARACGLI